MAYLGDIRENSISPEGIIWENDNRKDARYYWNGAFIDLCGLPGEDYATTIFVTDGAAVKKTTNTITISILKSNGVYAYKAGSKQQVATDIEIELTIQDNENQEEKVKLSIKAGKNISETILTTVSEAKPQPIVKSSFYNPHEDETFKYNMILPKEEPKLPVAYTLSLKQGEIDTLSDSDIISKLNKLNKVQMKDSATSEEFTIELTPISVEGLKEAKPLEVQNLLGENKQDLIIVTDKNIDKIVSNDTDELSLWTKKGTLTIDNVKFNLWYKRDEENNSLSYICDSTDTSYIAGTQSFKFIIYYN